MRMFKLILTAAVFTALFSCATTDSLGNSEAVVSLNLVSTYDTGVFDESAAEIVTFDAASGRVFFVNANDSAVQIIENTTLVGEVTFGDGAANSVVSKNGIIAVAVEADNKQAPGKLYFIDVDGNKLNSVTVGSLPDMVTITGDGKYALVANEGEPSSDYSVDPEGTVSIVDLSKGAANLTDADVTTVQFMESQVMGAPVRHTGPEGTTFGQDMEPEYIAISGDNAYAFVAMQENNAIAKIDIAKAQVVFIKSLGAKDHSLAGNGLDASNKDDNPGNIKTWPVMGLYMPDAIAAHDIGGKTYIFTANEGDSREYEDGDFSYIDEDRIKDITLDPSVFPKAAELQDQANLGRLKILNTEGDIDGDGDYDALYSMGARSFSIWDEDLNLVWDSGDAFEQTILKMYPETFNASNDNLAADDRSDDKGPEPEAVAIGEIDGATYAFIGAERFGGIFVYNVSNPKAPVFVEYVLTRNMKAAVNEDLEYDDTSYANTGDLGPEGFAFVPASQSSTGSAMLIVGNEVSGTVNIFEVK
jgi:2',3'-cyclic-nucleotide 2'-phosphodiesterase/3'-nucleotidase/5'-nucleotidase